MEIKTCLLIIQKNNLETEEYAKKLYEAKLQINNIQKQLSAREKEVQKYKKEYKSKNFNINSHNFFNFSYSQLEKLNSEIQIIESKIQEFNKKIYFLKSQNNMMADKIKNIQLVKEKKADLIQTDEQNNFLFTKKTQEANSCPQ